jgi:hypothetical protein
MGPGPFIIEYLKSDYRYIAYVHSAHVKAEISTGKRTAK